MAGEADGQKRPSVTQTVINGTIGSPAVFSALLVVCAFLLGRLSDKIEHLQGELNDRSAQLREDMGKTERELRILQVHMENTNAILIREGIKKPGDDLGTGPTGSH